MSVEVSFDRFSRPPIRGAHAEDDDTIDWSEFISALFQKEVYLPIFIALRITAVVALPIGILTRHPKTMNVFPTHSVMGLWGIVSSQTLLGNQIAVCVTMYQIAIAMLVSGTFFNAVAVAHNHAAWWCTIFFSVFVVSLFGNYRGKRLAVLHVMLMLLMQRLPGGTELIFAPKVCRDLCIVTTIALVQCLLPPMTVARECDAAMAKGYSHCISYVRGAARACWAGDRVEANVALRSLSTAPLRQLFGEVEAKFVGIMYEFWESTLRLELRRERVALLKEAMTRLNVLSDVARLIVSRRVYRDDERAAAGTHAPYGDSNDGKSAAGALALGGPSSMWSKALALISDDLDNFLDALEGVMSGLGAHLNPSDVAAKVPFRQLQAATEDLEAQLNRVHYELLIKGNGVADPFVYINTIYFHQTLVALAQQLLLYGDLMLNFDRSRYRSQWQRIWEFFFYDYWRAFWRELPHRLWPTRPQDIRLIKDGLKLACAYTIGVVYTLYMDPENVYFFGMAILMSVGLPHAGDTMVASIYRVTGMTIGCSIAYVACWHSHDLVGELAIAIAGIFIALIFREKYPYLHTAQYASMLVLPGLNSAPNRLTLLARIVSNTFTVMTYYVIVVFFFRINVMKLSDTAHARAVAAVADRFSGLADVAAHPFYSGGRGANEEEGAEERRAHVQELLSQQAAARVPMWARLAAFGSSITMASVEPMLLGLPYPLATMREAQSSLLHMASATDLLLQSLAGLHRPDRQEPPRQVAVLLYTIAAPHLPRADLLLRQLLQDMVDAFARPLEWDARAVHRHLADFKLLRHDLRAAFVETHAGHAAALRRGNRVGRPNANFDVASANTSFAANPTLSFATRSMGGGGGGGAENASIVFDVLQPQPQPTEDARGDSTHHPTRRNSYLRPAGARGEDPLSAGREEAEHLGLGNMSFAARLRPEECTLNVDVMHVVSLLVATDIIFAECERLVGTIDEINRYARSTRPAHRLPCLAPVAGAVCVSREEDGSSGPPHKSDSTAAGGGGGGGGARGEDPGTSDTAQHYADATEEERSPYGSRGAGERCKL